MREIQKKKETTEEDEQVVVNQTHKHDPNNRFYEEDLEESDYDKAMIEELFNKQKFKFNRHS